jgi:glycosyltransferase involved in cell wall biosynthesis
MAQVKYLMKSLTNLPANIFKRKVFCISMQRNGTTSVGDFLSQHGYRVARYEDARRNKWTYFWSIGDYKKIFHSVAFNSFQAYEDDPWWMPDFYKYLFHKYPKAKFILFYRNSDKWFNSMVKHSDGKTLGNTRIHSKIYRRMGEFYKALDSDIEFKPKEYELDNLFTINDFREHYTGIYEEYNREAIEFFNRFDQKRLFVADLEDKLKWVKLGAFLNLSVDENYEVHSNKSI